MFDLIPGAAGLDPQLHFESEFVCLAKVLIKQAKDTRQRRMLLVAGEPDWCRRMARCVLALPEPGRVTWVSAEEMDGIETVEAWNARQLLGQERDVVVFDAHSGFDPDAFGAVSGVICGGGLLIVLCPPLPKWEHIPDPACERIAISPYTYKDISGRFIRRLVRVLREATGICLVEQGQPLPVLSVEQADLTRTSSQDEFLDDVFRTADQKAAVKAIEHVLHGHRRRPAVLISDRGRGKTAALGIAAARLTQDAFSRADHSKGYLRILVTAPHARAIESLLSHAQQLLPGAERIENGLLWKGSQIQYLAPDRLCDSRETVDLVLVDEAAAIPTSILTRLLAKYSRLVFSTTVHGYEGTGRGFAIRFRQTLDENTPGWNEVTLTQPVRWAENDPVEQLVFRTLLLDAEGSGDEAVSGYSQTNVVIDRLNRDALVDDDQVLGQLFGLLVSAHYQTSPNDLRNLLDGPAVSVYVMRSADRKQVVATALVSTEGEFSDELADAIWSGQRRPRGHLISQSLVTHLGIRQAASLRCARIMRIAVHPAAQRKGLGSELIRFIKSDTANNGYHLFGTSFGATADLLEFWKAQDLLPVRVGFRRDHSSGEHSVMMLDSHGRENSRGAEVVKLARQRFCNDLPHWLSDALRELDSTIAMALLDDIAFQEKLSGNDLQMVKSFIAGARSYEDCSAELWRFCLLVMSSYPHLLQDADNDPLRIKVLLAKLIQKRSWQDVINMSGVNGRNEVVTLLRSALSHLLERHEHEFEGTPHVGN